MFRILSFSCQILGFDNGFNDIYSLYAYFYFIYLLFHLYVTSHEHSIGDFPALLVEEDFKFVLYVLFQAQTGTMYLSRTTDVL
jgi:hypothetical protein